MEVNLYNLEGNAIGKVKLPKVFEFPIREDLIWRAVLATQSKLRQPYGSNKLAGKRTSAHYEGKRRTRYSMIGRGIARLPRLHSKTVPFLFWEARFVPQARKGREAHPPKIEKIWERKINKKERRIAIKSCIAATSKKDLVLARGHRVSNLESLPIVVEDKIEELKKTKELVKFLEKLGLKEELERIYLKKIRAGKGKMRGRRYKRKKGPLIVISENRGISNAVKNLPGIDLCRVENLSAYYLAPGSKPGRLTIFTKSALEKLEKLL